MKKLLISMLLVTYALAWSGEGETPAPTPAVPVAGETLPKDKTSETPATNPVAAAETVAATGEKSTAKTTPNETEGQKAGVGWSSESITALVVGIAALISAISAILAELRKRKEQQGRITAEEAAEIALKHVDGILSKDQKREAEKKFKAVAGAAELVDKLLAKNGLLGKKEGS